LFGFWKPSFGAKEPHSRATYLVVPRCVASRCRHERRDWRESSVRVYGLEKPSESMQRAFVAIASARPPSRKLPSVRLQKGLWTLLVPSSKLLLVAELLLPLGPLWLWNMLSGTMNQAQAEQAISAEQDPNDETRILPVCLEVLLHLESSESEVLNSTPHKFQTEPNCTTS
jgi:hypothetical protein